MAMDFKRVNVKIRQRYLVLRVYPCK